MSNVAPLPVSGKSLNLSAPENFLVPHSEASADDAHEAAVCLLEQAEAGLTLLLVNGENTNGFRTNHLFIINQLVAIRDQVIHARTAMGMAGGLQ